VDIRRACLNDLEAMQPVLEQLMNAKIEQRDLMWTESLNHPGYVAWVAEVDNALVGFVDLFVFPDVAHGFKIGLISNLVVDQSYQGRGLGERLLSEAIRHSKQQGVRELHVWTSFDNKRAIGLYRKVGFADRALLLEAEL
jgi:GNAT superfamily N-acetyltransferase